MDNRNEYTIEIEHGSPTKESTKKPLTNATNCENIVDFEGPDDPADPVNWSSNYKWFIVFLVSLMSLVINLAILMCAPVTPLILAEFHSDNLLDSTILVSIWELGEVLGPLIIAPMSETIGRLPVYHSANVLFILFSIAAAESRNINMLITFRFCCGLTVASATLNSSIVGDMFKQEERGRAISIMGMTPFIGPLLGPTIGAYVALSYGWRWTFWLVAIITALFELLFLFSFRESYKVQILARKAKQLRKATGNKDLHSPYESNSSKLKVIIQSTVRPLQLLFISAPVFLISFSGGIACSYTYVIVTSLSKIFEDVYRFQEGPIGLAFLGLGIGMIFGVAVCSITLDWYLKKKSVSHNEMKPEYRLPPMIFGGILIPIGFFIFGWTAQSRIYWIVPIIATSLIGFGFVAILLAGSSYLVDAFGIHAASALAAAAVLRNIMAALLPLAGPPLYSKLDYGWGSSVFSFIALGCLPIPLLLMSYGEGLRRRSRFQVLV